MVAEEITNVSMESTIKRWNVDDQCKLYQDVIQYLGLTTKILKKCASKLSVLELKKA